LPQALRQHDSLVLMKVYGRFAASKRCWRRRSAGCRADDVRSHAAGRAVLAPSREVSDDQPLPYFSTILVNKQWEEANET
jgi:precorrin-2/cobalt-factor-2 C20-methyltransferase